LLATGAVTLSTFDDGWRFVDTMMTTMAWLGVFLLVSQLLLSVICLHSERDTGALELLLVTTLKPETLVKGRVSAIRWAFLPAAALLTLGWLVSIQAEIAVVSYRYAAGEVPWEPLVIVLISFLLLTLLLPVIGLCFSLSRPGVISGAFNAFFFAVMLPWGALPALFGIGYMLHHEIVQPATLRVWPLWIELLVWIGATGGFQAVLWYAIRRGKLEGYPRLLPDWFVRCRLGWILPWAIPVGVAGFLTFGGLGLLQQLLYAYEWFPFIVWQMSSWIVLLLSARCCWQAAVWQLEERTFSQTG
ncbi:MAG TPA: hypothetical protein DCY13_06025, partial [Verrucomicrobiales bacterium]|nr:hypothetical protein [Verrucomicrobiales bacterium]